MPPRSRHAPLPAANNTYQGYGNTVPRHQAIPQSDVCFSSPTLDPDMINLNFSLSSSANGSRHYDLSAWNDNSGSVPRVDDFLPVSGYDSMSLSGTCFPMPMMHSTSDATDVTYDLATGETLSRHAPLDTESQVSGLTPNMMMDDYFVDFNQEDALVNGAYLTDFGSHQSLTPPPEEILQRYFNDQGAHGRHDKLAGMKQEPTVGENLGVSKLQAYSVSRHSVAQPRPIRPSSERTDTQSTGHDSVESRHSPKDDHLDKVKARNDPLYDAKPDKDGLYHCPFTKRADKCSHKPTKQKCIYSKYLDSHLRPYKCKFAAPNSDCEEARFSSNACLFRHERETHGMHNHGHNPYLCQFRDCERAKEGNGFPRRWNQRDHMKRMHGWEGDDSSNDRHAEGSRRRRAPPASVPMRRSGSSSYARTQQAAVAYSKDHRRSSTSATTSRHAPQVSYAAPMQACNVVAYPSSDGVQFSQSQYLAQSRHGQPLVAAYSYQTVY